MPATKKLISKAPALGLLSSRISDVTSYYKTGARNNVQYAHREDPPRLRVIEMVTKAFSSILDGIISFLANLAKVLLALLMLGIILDVFMRYFLNKPIFWMPEVSEYALLYITFLGGAWVLKRKKHVKMDLLLNLLSERALRIVNLIDNLVGAMICAVLTWYGVKATWKYFKMGFFPPTLLEPPLYIILAIIPLGTFFLLIQFLRDAYNESVVQKAKDLKDRT